MFCADEIFISRYFWYICTNKSRIAFNMNKIKLVLDKKGIKQKWLAEQLGKSFNMVNSYVQNRTQPSIETLYKIASILDVEIDELLYSKNDIEQINKQ